MTQPRRKRTRYVDQRVRAQELLNAEDPPMPASRIATIIQREFKSDGPGERQIRNWIRDGVIGLEPDAAPWTIAHAERPEDIPIVLEVIGKFHHPIWWPTAAQGRWMARLSRAFPAMDHVMVFEFARKAVRTEPLVFTKELLELRRSTP